MWRELTETLQPPTVCQGLRGDPQTSLALTSPTHPGAPISAQPGVCQATDPAEPDPLRGLLARPALGLAPRPASPRSTLALLCNFHFCMSLASDRGTDLFLPVLIVFPYRAQTFRAGCLAACSGQMLLDGAGECDLSSY